MINAVKKSFGCQLNSLTLYLKENYHSGSPESGFANYVFHQTNSSMPFETANNVNISTIDQNRLSEAPTLAAVGYALVCGKHFNNDFLEIWADGLLRLSGRNAFPLHRNSFFYRPIELFGIALGTNHYYKNQPEKLVWLQDIFTQGEKQLIHSDFWTFLLSAYAAHILSINWKLIRLPLVDEMDVDQLALVKWLRSVAPTFASKFGVVELEPSIDKALLEYSLEYPIPTNDSARVALLHFAIKKTIIQIIQSNKDDIEQICSNPQQAIEWLHITCDKIHVVTQHLQSCFQKSISELPKIRSMQILLQVLSTLRDDICIIDTEISEQIRMHSSLYISNNHGNIFTGDILNMTQNQESITNQTKINTSNSTIGFINSGSGTVCNFSQHIGQNIDEVTKLITSLREIAKQFPDTQREEALVYLDDLQEDISTPEKQKPERIKIRLTRLLAIGGTIAGIVAGATDFSNNVLELSQKLNVPIELNHHSIPKIPPSTSQP
ncbi:hypothetical protein DSM106972_052870 [Dulcicalothrix desertica PCC 7102]|uniref:Uncharacterized protein n=1 Tax=Dulcicalothrix desertica PCC 7102 TaxID=232991 RepID=A0A3S1IWV0_9CYAN|nr:hypothetical protein [Dulcicalothrix desertica]RUT03648.1 hypothetical protein DSM106972_052870 [Dulcicalothrix desertica PCC 7102]TWH43912.1 hypothetical protein CAL7102_07664 [Dulcicalothrix desertica PCC 7102]